MIDFDTVPANVQRLAIGCFLQHVGPAELLEFSPPDAAAVAEIFDISVEEYIAAMKWLTGHNKRHIHALQRWNKRRRQLLASTGGAR
jgi:hypothetical protein